MAASFSVNSVAAAASADQTHDANQFVDEMSRAVAGLHDYTCDSELDTFKPENKKSKCHFFWKDNQVRIEVTGGGFRDGTVVVKQKSGAVTAVGGLMLGHIHLNLDPDSRMLILPNGTNCTKTDFPTLMVELKKYLAQGLTARVTNAPVASTEAGNNLFILEYLDPKAQNAVKLRIYVSPDQHLPVRWDMLDGTQITSSAHWRNLRTNNNLNPQLFQL